MRATVEDDVEEEAKAAEGGKEEVEAEERVRARIRLVVKSEAFL